MTEHTYKVTELVGSSKKGIEDAAQNAVAKAAKTVRNLRWIEVSEIRGKLDGNKIDSWQVSVKLGFTLED